MVEKLIEGLTVEEMVAKYTPMVHKAVHSAQKNCVCNAEDMVQEGFLAIVEAFNTYTPGKGTAFITWVYTRINGAILDYQKRHLSALASTGYLYTSLKKLGPDATPEQLIEMGHSKESAYAAMRIKNSFLMVDVDALEEVLFDDDNIYDMIDLKAFDWKKYLTEKEVDVIELFYGLSGQEPMSMSAIARKFGRSTKTLTETKERALRKLRNVPGIEDLL